MVIEPKQAHDKIREACLRRPELRWRNPPKKNDKELFSIVPYENYRGFCYIATYAFCYLVKEAKPYTIDRKHFWAQINDEIWDLTKEQFDYSYNYENGKRLRRPSKLQRRVKELVKEAGYA